MVMAESLVADLRESPEKELPEKAEAEPMVARIAQAEKFIFIYLC